jgi:hypothetical protein
VENRVLPAGPTVVDIIANGAFYFGLVRTLAREDRPAWSQMSFSAAEENFHAAARRGIEATVHWPRVGEIRVTDLVLEGLLPKAYAGLDRFGVSPAIRDRLLGIIEQRCLLQRNGAVWQTEAVAAAERTRDLGRADALHDMLQRYGRFQRTNEPVHSWPVD